MRKIFVSILFIILLLSNSLTAFSSLDNEFESSSFELKVSNDKINIYSSKNLVGVINPPVINDLGIEKVEDKISIPFFTNNLFNWNIEVSDPSDIEINRNSSSQVLNLKFKSDKTYYKLSSPLIKIKDNNDTIKINFKYNIQTQKNSKGIPQAESDTIIVNFFDNQKRILGISREIFNIHKQNTWSLFQTYITMPTNVQFLQIQILKTSSDLLSASFSDFVVLPISYSKQQFKLVDLKEEFDTVFQEFSNGNEIVKRTTKLSPINNIITVEEENIFTKDTQIYKQYTSLDIYSKPKYIMNRDSKIYKINQPSYVIDSLTPFYFGSSDLSVGYTDNYESYEVYNQQNTAKLKFYLVHPDDVKYFVIGRNREHIYTLTQLYKKGAIVKNRFTITPPNFSVFVTKSFAPNKYKAALLITNHSDSNMTSILKAMMFGTTDTKSPFYKKKGFIGYKIPATWGFFYKSVKGIDGFDNPEYRKIIEEMSKNNIEVVLHTASPVSKENTKELIEKALAGTKYLNINDWIDHSIADGTRCADLKSEGSIKSSTNYSFNIFLKYGYKYCWSYNDEHLDSLNMLQPNNYSYHPQIIFKNYNFGEGDSLYQWDSYRPRNLIKEVTQQSLEKLIDENGISILHDYFTHPMQKNKFFFGKNKNVYLTKEFDNMLSMLAEYRNKGLVWIPTVREFGDYQELLKNIYIYPYNKNLFIVDNHNNVQVKDFTFIIYKENKELKREIYNVQPGMNYILIQ
ncbi:hypothetical protein ACAG39_04935 [Caldicellulosiruptoraceae bacterium PP1]